MSNTFNAANMAKLSTDSIESMKPIELDKCKDIIQCVAKSGKREAYVDIANPLQPFIRAELEALGFQVEIGPTSVLIGW